MCTALIYRNINAQLLGVGFNRDESYFRKKAAMPQFHEHNGVSALYPTDGDFGGTWIGINQKGECFALLNYYEATLNRIEDSISRGLLVKSLLHQEIKMSSLNAKKLKSYYPFRLLNISLKETLVYTWDGDVLTKESDNRHWALFGSSFTQGTKAEEIRNLYFDKYYSSIVSQTNLPGFLEIAKGFLTSHLPEKSALSPCMHQEISHTTSQSIFEIFKNKAKLDYKNTQPCESNDMISYQLNFIR